MKKLSMEGDEEQQIAVSVPLFLRKLWKMVNDDEAENIIGWNSSGDGFIIYDQLQFITKLLPKYFKHNNMASFIRQLNFYDFHKVAGIDKDEIHFTHNYFLKDVPETLAFIRRKCTSLRSKLANNAREEEIAEILRNVKELKTKHSLVNSELKLLKQENAALWNEVNNLRLKHAKQTKIINKIIHFLISYIHSHQSSMSKGKVGVGRRNSQNLKTGPTILEIDYHNSSNDDTAKSNSYPFAEPGHSGAITYPSEVETFTNLQPAEQTLDEILDKIGASVGDNKRGDSSAEDSNKDELDKAQFNMLINSKPNECRTPNLEIDSDMKAKGLQDDSHMLYTPIPRKRQIPLENSAKYKILQNPKEHLGSYLDYTQVELESLQDLLNNLNSTELTNFCNLIEASEMEDVTDNIGQDLSEEVNYDTNAGEGNDEFIEFESLPLDSNTANEISVEDCLASGKQSNCVAEGASAEAAQNFKNIKPELIDNEYLKMQYSGKNINPL